MRAIVSPILLCWSTTSEADGGGMAVDIEPYHQYPLHFIAMWQRSRGAIWQNRDWYESAYEAKVYHWITPCRKRWHTNIHWHLLNTYTEQIVDVGISTGADFHEHGMQPFVHHRWKYIANSGNYIAKTVYCSWEFAAENLFYQIVLCSLYLL